MSFIPEQLHWVVGVCLAGGGGIISNLGTNLQKLTHIRIKQRVGTAGGQSDEQLDESSQKSDDDVPHHGDDDEDEPALLNYPYHREPLWLLGLSGVIFGAICDFLALGYANQSLVAPLGAMTLVSNVFLAPRISGEVVSRRDVLSTLVIVCGCGLTIAFAGHTNDNFTFQELFGFYQTWRFVLYASSVGGLLLFLWFLIKNIEEGSVGPARLPEEALIHVRKLKVYLRFYYAAISGIVGAQSILFAKAVAELVKENVASMWIHYETYVFIACCCMTIFAQIRWLNEGLAHFDALYMIPVFQSFWIGFSVMSGLWVYGEYKNIRANEVAGFAVGVGLTVLGVYSLSSRQVQTLGKGLEARLIRSQSGTAQIGHIPVEIGEAVPMDDETRATKDGHPHVYDSESSQNDFSRDRAVSGISMHNLDVQSSLSDASGDPDVAR